MDYYLNQKGSLSPSKGYPTLFKDPSDIRNYAVACLYKDGQDRVLRSEHLRYHYLALRALFTQTKELRKYISHLSMIDELFFDASASFCKNNGVLWCANAPDRYERENSNFLYLPAELDAYQKEELRYQYPYLCQEDFIYIVKYDPGFDMLIELNGRNPENYQKILENVL